MTASRQLPSAQRLTGIQQIIAVGSGKGGVGKSTLAALIAHAAARSGLRTGFLDADIYGSSTGLLFGDTSHCYFSADKKIIPAVSGNLKIVSMASLVPPEKAVIWRGALAMGAIRQMLFDVEWGKLDLLLVDLPPGTGDIVLSLAQSVIVDGVLLVTTPQDIAWADARRAAQLFNKLSVPILGVIENMSYFECDKCQTKSDIFGLSRREYKAGTDKLDVLARVPLAQPLREAADQSALGKYLSKNSALQMSITDLLKHIDIIRQKTTT